MNSAEYLKNLACRILHVPIMHGVDGRDCDDLDRLSRQQVRPVLASFVQVMETKLKLNEHKGGWDDTSIDDLYCRAAGELLELLSAIKAGKEDHIICECADVANYVMMIFDKVTNDTRRQGLYDFGGRDSPEGSVEADEAG